ncbi:MAG: hypothetical protein ACFFB2_04245 [Promethearchaeota archaeon]
MSQEKKQIIKKKLTVKLYKEQTSVQVSSELRERYRYQNRTKKIVFDALKSEPKTVTEITRETGIPSHQVLWYLATGLRYRNIEAVEKTDGDYWKYALIKQEK